MSMSEVRLFVAVFPPAPVADRLSEAARRLAATVPNQAVAWTVAEQIHLTLHFIGNVCQDRIGEFEQKVREACRDVGPFTIQARGLGCFPSVARARILWAGLEGGSGRLERLKANLDAALSKLGCVPESRPFHPHLTLGRVKVLSASAARALAAAMGEFRDTVFGDWTVSQIDLMQSTLLPAGAKYSTIRSFAIGS
jgi:2'-5' RNA ligase